MWWPARRPVRGPSLFILTTRACVSLSNRPTLRNGAGNLLQVWRFIRSRIEYIVKTSIGEHEMAQRRKRRYSRSASKDVEREMRRYKRGTARSGRGGKVQSRKQAIAIGLSEARKKGKRVPKKK
jgi:hypothetical protein